MTKALELSLALPMGDLRAYKQAVASIPMLSREEELALAERYRDYNDLDAAWGLVMAHLRFVVRIARGYDGYGLPQADLIQEGNIGLMKAVKRFDPSVGVRLVSFAVHWVRAQIHEYVLRNWRIVKVATTKAQRKLFFNLRGAKKRLGWMNQREVEGVARDLGVTTKDVLEMEQRLSAHDTAFDIPVNGDEETGRPAPAAYLQDQRLDPAAEVEYDDWQAHSTKQLGVAMDGLDERSRDIVTRRWLNDDKATLHQLAEQYGISAERIRQLEKNAMRKLRRALDS